MGKPGGKGMVLFKRKGIAPGDGWENGIYVYREGEWRLLRRDGEPFRIGELGDGVYSVYFNNTQCPVCRLFTPQYHAYTEIASRRIQDFHSIIVLCDWFTSACNSEAAKRTFQDYNVDGTPRVIIAAVKGGSIVDTTTIPGYVDSDRLLLIAQSYSRK